MPFGSPSICEPICQRNIRTDALGAAHKTAAGLHRIGLLDARTMRDFDASWLTPVGRLSPEEIIESDRRPSLDLLVREIDNPGVAII